MAATIHYFTDSRGPLPTSYYRQNFSGLDKSLSFSGYPHKVLGELLSSICLVAQRLGTPLQVIHNCLDNSLQGLILPELSAGAFGFEAGDEIHQNVLSLYSNQELISWREHLSAARKTFLRARGFHESQEKIYLENMDFTEADRLCAQTISRLMGTISGARRGREIHRFFGAATADGNLDYIPEITMDIPQRIFIKGRPGTGKSTFLKKVAAAALRRGFPVEIYHCSLDPKSLDLVAVRDLGFCILDSTSPHEYFPSRKGDEILDLYAQCVTPGTDQAYEDELDSLRRSYKTLVNTARGFLNEAKLASDRYYDSLPQPDPLILEDVKQRAIDMLFA